MKSIKTEVFAKLPETTLYTLKIEVLGQNTLWFKSKDPDKITVKMLATENFYGADKLLDNTVEITLDEFNCKDTFDVDENHVYTGLSCFRGEYL